MRFFGLLSRLWACNPSQSRCNPTNPGPIHHNHDCEGVRNHSQSKWFSHNQRGLQADCVHCCNTNYQCRARHCCNRRGNVCVQTWYPPLRSKQQKLDVFIFRNPVAIQFLFFAIHADCTSIARFPLTHRSLMTTWSCGCVVYHPWVVHALTQRSLTTASICLCWLGVRG